MSFCHKLRFSNPYLFSTQCRWPLIFQTMNKSNNLSLKSPRFKPSGCRDIGIRTFKFVAKTQFHFFPIELYLGVLLPWWSGKVLSGTVVNWASWHLCMVHLKFRLQSLNPINMHCKLQPYSFIQRPFSRGPQPGYL